MRHIDTKSLELAFVKPGTPMFSDVLQMIEDDGQLSPTRSRDLRSGLRRVAKALGRPLNEIPADPAWLQPRLAGVQPAAVCLTPKSWTNAVSDTKSAMAHTGIIKRTQNHKDDLSPAWRSLWGVVLASGSRTLQPALSRFVYFLNAHGVQPDKVADEHASAFLEALKVNEISKKPDTGYRAAVNGWNLAARQLASWPKQALTLPKRTNFVALPLDTYPDSFRSDLNAYFTRLAKPDPFAAEGNVDPLAEATITFYRTKVLYFAGALVRSGFPVADLRSLADLIAEGNAERGLRWLLERNGNQKNENLSKLSAILARVAREHAQVSEEDAAKVADFARRLKTRQQHGMTKKNRERLRIFDNPAMLNKLLTLPEGLQQRIKGEDWTFTRALMSEDAIAIGLLIYCPIRRKNLAGIHIGRNLQRFGDGRVFLVFEPEEVKNHQRIEFELPPALVKMIDDHLGKRSPILCPEGTPWLFPKRDGSKEMDRTQLSGRIKKRIQKEIGATVNAHLFRHLAAKVFLDANPGAYEVVRQLLGHSSLSKTLAAYAGFEAGTATRLFADVLSNARAK